MTSVWGTLVLSKTDQLLCDRGFFSFPPTVKQMIFRASVPAMNTSLRIFLYFWILQASSLTFLPVGLFPSLWGDFFFLHDIHQLPWGESFMSQKFLRPQQLVCWVQNPLRAHDRWLICFWMQTFSERLQASKQLMHFLAEISPQRWVEFRLGGRKTSRPKDRKSHCVNLHFPCKSLHQELQIEDRFSFWM